MKTIIAGSRTLAHMEQTCLQRIRDLVKKENIIITRGISGAAKGPDKFGEKYFKEIGVEFDQYFPNWDLHGKAAGYKRNTKMAENAEQLIALLDFDSATGGTKHMIETAKDLGLKVWVIEFNLEPQAPPTAYKELPGFAKSDPNLKIVPLSIPAVDPRQIPLF